MDRRTPIVIRLLTERGGPIAAPHSLKEQLAARKAERLAERKQQRAAKAGTKRALTGAPRRCIKAEAIEKLYLERTKREHAVARLLPRKRAEFDAKVAAGLAMQAEAVRNLHARYNSVPYSLLVLHGIIEERSLVALDVDPEVAARAVAAGLAAPVWSHTSSIDEQIAYYLREAPESREERDDDEGRQDLAA